MNGRFYLSAMSRWVMRSCIVVAIAAISLAGPVPVPGMAQDDDLPLDLAAMTLRPGDLEAEGYEAHGLGNSIMTADPAAAGAYIGFWRGDDAGDVMEEALDEAGPEGTYMMQLIETGTPGDISSGVESRVLSYVIEFEDEDTATEGFAELAEAWETDGMEEAESDSAIGEEHVLVAGEARERAGTQYQRADLLFRTDRLVTGVSVEVFDATPPEVATVEALAGRQAERIESVLEDGGPGLSHQILRLDVPGQNATFDMYSVIDGDVFAFIGETPEDTESYQELVDDIGMVDQYEAEHQFVGDSLDFSASSVGYFVNRVVRFEDEDAASAYMQDSANRLVEGGAADLEEIEDLPALGDEIVAYTYTHTRSDGVTFDDYRIYARIDANFFTMAINTTEDFDIEAVNELAELQADCLSGEASCLQPEDIPRNLVGLAPENRLTLSMAIPAWTGSHRRG